MGEWIKEMWYTHTHSQWNITQSQEEGNPAICENTEEPRGHYARLNKSEKDKHCIIYNLKKKKCHVFTQTENLLVVPEVGCAT